jgi:hypothetical protein
MRIAALFCLLLCLVLQTASQAAGSLDTGVSFIGLKNHYSPDQAVSFQITSAETKDIRISCAVEQLMSTGWREVSMSIFAGDPAKATRIVVLQPRKGLPVEWDPWRKAPDAPFPPGRYRFRADVRVSGSATQKAIYSRPFALEPPK